MVVEIKDLGETGPGSQLFIPASIGALGFQQIFDAVAHAQAVGVAAGNQAHDGPGGLRRCARRGGEGAVVVAGTAFAPAAVGILDGAEPLAGAENVRLAIALARCGQASQRETGAVDVRHAPTAVPASVGLLVPDQPIHALPY